MFNRGCSKIIRAMLAVTFLLNVGCATMTTGTTQVIAINSTPQEAIATVEGIQIRTPGQITLKKGSKYTLKVEKSGYEAAQVELERKFNHAFWLNILWGPVFIGIPIVIGTIWDFASGAVWNITPESVHLTLKEIGATPKPTTPAAPTM
jgi:hypothetical protein